MAQCGGARGRCAAFYKTAGNGRDYHGAEKRSRATGIAGCRSCRHDYGESPRIHAVTDVTGFSLLGHAREMALGHAARGIAPASFEIDHAAFEYFPGAVEAAREGHLSGG